MSPQQGNSMHPCCVFKVCPVSELPPGGDMTRGHTHAKPSALVE